jgi:hypothetical protein
MADFPIQQFDIPGIIMPWQYSELSAWKLTAGVPAWPTANKAVFVPFEINYPVTVVKGYWLNGGTVGTDSIDIGIYDLAGNLIVSGGGTLSSGASVIQSVDITDTLLLRGNYYAAMAINGTTDTVSRITPASIAEAKALGLLEMTSAYVLPATVTYASITTTASLPLINFTTQTTI